MTRKLNLENRDPDRHYVYAYLGDDHLGFEYYRDLGYRTETHHPDGVRPGGSSGKQDEEITFRGHVLMSIDNETREEIDRYGADGMSGLELADKIEAKISGNKSRSGLAEVESDGRYFDFGNDTEPQVVLQE